MATATIIQVIAVAAGIGMAFFITAIALRNWQGDKFLCDDCLFNDAEKCSKPERPKAIDCLAYQRASHHDSTTAG